MPIYPYGTYPSGASFNSSLSSIPAYERVSSIPSWLPTQESNERELRDQYAGTNSAYDTSEFDRASKDQQSRVLTTAMNAGNNAATEYANRARQAGGSGMGAGLIKAEAGVNAQATAGQMELDRAKFDADQRDKAATHATAIATTLGNLRQSYLQSLVSYATSEDATNASYAVNQRNAATNERQVALAEEEANRRRGGPAYSIGSWDAMSPFNFTDVSSANRYFQENQGRQTAHGYIPMNFRAGGG